MVDRDVAEVVARRLDLQDRTRFPDAAEGDREGARAGLDDHRAVVVAHGGRVERHVDHEGLTRAERHQRAVRLVEGRRAGPGDARDGQRRAGIAGVLDRDGLDAGRTGTDGAGAEVDGVGRHGRHGGDTRA